MELILDWIKEYSPGIVFILAVGSALLYLIKNVAEKAISQKFDIYIKELEKRSRFEEKILIERYELITDIAKRLEFTSTKINRYTDGIEIPNFIENGNVIPLIEIEEKLGVYKYLLTEKFYNLFKEMSEKLNKIAVERTKNIIAVNLINEYLILHKEFEKVIDEDFGISFIKWK
jgi:hypothetical protein